MRKALMARGLGGPELEGKNLHWQCRKPARQLVEQEMLSHELEHESSMGAEKATVNMVGICSVRISWGQQSVDWYIHPQVGE